MDVKRLKDEVKKLNTMPFHLGSFVLSIWKRIMNIFIHANNGFCTNDFYCTDTDSLYNEKMIRINWRKLI